jgi:DNA-binding Lrp family transcriptional regulator
LNANQDLKARDKALINLLSGDLPLSARPFEEIGKKLGMTEDEVIKAVTLYKERGLIRRLGAILVHQQSGFSSNAMLVWEFSPDEVETAGKTFASLPYVSHCYQRDTAPGWPYNLYTMIHAESQEGLANMASEMHSQFKNAKWAILESLKELKKSSVNFFPENSPD